MTQITLKNGITIVNFSSPHPFTFETGEVLPACTPEEANRLMLVAEEIEHNNGRWIDIELTLKMSDAVRDALVWVNMNPNVDIILVPLPVLIAIKEAGLVFDKCRAIRMADRISKIIHSDKFCI
jgi:hypothetical protein